MFYIHKFIILYKNIYTSLIKVRIILSMETFSESAHSETAVSVHAFLLKSLGFALLFYRLNLSQINEDGI